MKVLPAASLFLLCVLPGCGGGGADQAIAALVPADAVAVVRLLSIDDLVDTARTAAKATGAPDQMIGANEMLAGLGPMGGDTDQIDLSKPIAFALVAPRAVQPTPLVFVPARDPAKYAASLQANGMQPVIDGSYVVLSLGGKYEKPAQPSPLFANLPAGLVAARVDVEKATANLGAMIGAGLAAFETMAAQQMQAGAGELDASAIVDLYVSGAKALLASGQRLDLGVDVADGQLQFDASMHMKPGSELDGWGSAPVDFSSHAAVLTGRSAVDVVMVADWKQLWPRFEAMFEPMVDIYPPAWRTPMRELMKKYAALYEAMGPVAAGEVAFTPEGQMNFLLRFDAGDAKAFVAGLDEVTRWPKLAEIGVNLTAQDASAEAGVSVRDYQLQLDRSKLPGGPGSDAEWEQVTQMMASILGKDGMRLRIAYEGQRAVMAMGGSVADAAAALKKTGGSWPKSLRGALERVGDCNPMIVERLDFAAMFGFVAKLEAAQGRRAMPAPPPGLSADMVVAAGIKGHEWRAHFTMDLAGFGDVVKAMMPR